VETFTLQTLDNDFSLAGVIGK